MGKIYDNLTALKGKTLLLKNNKVAKLKKLEAEIIAKLEYFNPMGSIKDRIALAMINEAEKNGVLKDDTVIIEPTSGNTGIALAAIAASRGYKIILTMPETMSIERRLLLQFYGAEIVLTDGASGMKGAISKALELKDRYKDSFIPGQFNNPANPAVHRVSTGPEIWEDTGGNIDFFVSGVGTGGTISGTGEYLKSKNPGIKIIAVEPFSSPFLSEGKTGIHKIQGIGAGFIPDTLNTDIYDEIIKVTNEDAFTCTKILAKTEGLLAGISSGASLYAAEQLSLRPENKGKNIVVILPDSGERYLSEFS
jgi:cysteine synthase A